MNPSEHEFDETLLTAYLDDELSSQERESVETQLKSSAASRHLLAELQAIRDLLQKMPLPAPHSSIANRPWNTAHESVSNAPHTDLRPVIRPSQESDWTIPWRTLLSLAAVLAIAVTGGLYWSNSLRPRTESLSMRVGQSNANEEKPSESPSALDSKALSKKNAPVSEESIATANATGANSALEQEVADTESSMSAAVGKETIRNLALPQARKKQDPSLALSSPAPPPAPTAATAGMSGGYGATNQLDEKRKPALSESNRLMEPGQLELNTYLREAEALKATKTDALDRTEFEWIALETSDRADSADTKVLFRFQRTGPTQASETTTPRELGRKDFTQKVAQPSSPSFVEFEIPTTDWQPAANRLQQLGIPVPNEPPDVGVLRLDAFAVSIPRQEAKSKTESAPAHGAVSNQIPWVFKLSNQGDQASRSQVAEKLPSIPEAGNKTDVIRVQIRVAPKLPQAN